MIDDYKGKLEAIRGDQYPLTMKMQEFDNLLRLLLIYDFPWHFEDGPYEVTIDAGTVQITLL